VLANKFGYSVVREVILSNIREFYPDIPAHNISKHRERVAPSPPTTPPRALIQSGIH
jgi:hypothetical protein